MPSHLFRDDIIKYLVQAGSEFPEEGPDGHRIVILFDLAIAELAKENDRLEDENASFREELLEAEEKEANLHTSCNRLRRLFEEVREYRDRLEESNRVLVVELDRADRIRVRMLDEQEAFQARIDELREENEKLEEAIVALRVDVREAEDKEADLREELETARVEVRKLDSDLDRALEDLNHKKIQLQGLRIELLESKSLNAILQRRVDSLEAELNDL